MTTVIHNHIGGGGKSSGFMGMAIFAVAIGAGFAVMSGISGNGRAAPTSSDPASSIAKANPIDAPYKPIRKAFAEKGHKYFETTTRYAVKYGLDPNILAIQQGAESMYRPTVCSRDKRGNIVACGLTQFIPGTAKKYGVVFGGHEDAVETQIRGQARYMRKLLDDFNGDYVMAVFAYNQGEGNARRYLNGARFRTVHGREYVKRILGVELPIDGSKYKRMKK